MITRDEFDRMSESELRQQVLVPLLKRMGFRDVFEYHGGSEERGNDIVMWRADALACREDYSVVVKVGKVTGQAAGGRDSASTVTFQVSQALGKPHRDPLTGEDRQSVHCWVVASGAIPKETVGAIEAALGPSRRQSVRFVAGDRLWELVEQYLSDQVAIEHLLRAAPALESASEHHRVVATVRGGQVQISVEPKHPDADALEPLAIETVFDFPETPEGLAAREAFTSWVRTGAPAAVPQAFVREITLPEFLRRFVPVGPAELALGQVRGDLQLNAAAVMSAPTGEEVRLEGLELRAVQVGSDEITTSNAHQGLPWTFVIRATRESGTEVTFRLRLANVPVKRLIEGVRFAVAAAAGGRLRIENCDTGEVILSGAGHFRIPTPPAPWLRLLEMLVAIQDRCGVVLRLPAGPISGDELRRIADVAHIVTYGRTTVAFNELSLTLTPQGVAAFRAKTEEAGRHAIRIENEVEVELLGTRLSLGRAVWISEDVKVHPSDIKSLDPQAEASGTGGTTIRLVPGSANTILQVQYPRWLPSEG